MISKYNLCIFLVSYCRIDPKVGFDMQSLSAIGNPVAWLFAEPKNGGVNGFTLTGGIFNYTADIKFHGTGNRATLNFVFQGLDAFGYLRYFFGGESSQTLSLYQMTLKHLPKKLKHFHEF